jgi:hypothetical protein
MKVSSVVLFLLVGTIAQMRAALAQDASEAIDRWQRETGIYVTKAERDQFPSYQADQFDKATYASDFPNKEQIKGAIRRSRVELSALGDHKHAVWMNERGQTQHVPGDQNTTVVSLFSRAVCESLPVAFLTPARGLRKNAMHSRRFPGTP